MDKGVSFRAAETARNLATASYAHSCQKACIAFERSFGALRQPQDDNVGSALSIYRDSSKRDAKQIRFRGWFGFESRPTGRGTGLDILGP